MSKSAFGSTVPKFVNAGIHPKLQSFNSALSTSVPANIGPGSYETKLIGKTSHNQFKSELWKKQYNLEQEKQIPHFTIKEKKHAQAEMKRQLGPGYYDIDIPMNHLGRSIRLTTVLQSKAPRFKDLVKDSFPGPSTYGIPQEIIDGADKRRRYSNSVGLLDRGGRSTRLPSPPPFHIGPGIYNLQSPVDQVLNRQVGKRGFYDCNSIDRSLPIQTGHHAILITHNLGPGQYNSYKEMDRFQDKYNCFKGKFLREKQYPDKPYQRVFWSDPGNIPVDKTNQVSPASYDIGQSITKKENSKAGFGSLDVRMNKFAMANFTGGNNPLIGPGRYNCDSKEMGESSNGYESVFKSLVAKISDAKTKDILRHRVRPLNIPTDRKPRYSHVASDNSLRDYTHFNENLKRLVLS